MLDALDALGSHRRSVIVVGAHAIYLRVHTPQSALAPFTTDSDLAIDPRILAEAPRLEEAMREAGFALESAEKPGVWLRSYDGGVDEVDLLVPAELGGSGRRAARIPPHANRTARKATGLEGVLVDNEWMNVPSLEPGNDPRVVHVRVAGPAGLLVAKLFKLSDRIAAGKPDRTADKDAHDVFRILIGVPSEELRDRYLALLDDDLTEQVAVDALAYLEKLFAAGPNAVGSVMAGRAETGVGEPEIVEQQVASLASEFLGQFQAV